MSSVLHGRTAQQEQLCTCRGPAGSTQVSVSVQPHVVHGLGSDLADLWRRGQVTPAGLLQSSPELSLSRTAASRKAGPETCLS